VILSDDDGVPLRSKCVDTVHVTHHLAKTMQVWMYVFSKYAVTKRAVYSFTDLNAGLPANNSEWGMKVRCG
jgi:hypothetical protein